MPIALHLLCMLLLHCNHRCGFVVTVASAANDDNATTTAPQYVLNFGTFEAYKAHHNKTYLRPFNEQRARDAFADNHRFIAEHNAHFADGRRRFAVRANSLADLSNEQYIKTYVRLTRSHRRKVVPLDSPDNATTDAAAANEEEEVGSAKSSAPTAAAAAAAKPPPSSAQNTTKNAASLLGAAPSKRTLARLLRVSDADAELPATFDWRQRGFVTGPKNQKSCGACYAFAIAMAIEGQVFRRTGELVALSAQQLLDCTAPKAWGNHGCAGGSLRNTLRYVRSTAGLMREADYPYAAAQHQCDYNPGLAVAQINAWDILPARDETAMLAAVARIGPIAVSINGSPKSFQLYSHGVYDDAAACSADFVNHAMLVVGYTEDAWILKNWWGSRWGDGGYMHIARGKNMCGLANYVAYAVI